MQRLLSQRRSNSWLIGTVCLLLIIQFISVARTVTSTSKTEITPDVLYYLHFGWSITQGVTPYVHFWDPKPPLVHELSFLMATITGENMLLLYIFSIAVTGLAAVLCGVLVALLTFELTDSGSAAVFSAAALYSFAGFHITASQGYRPKFFAALFGLLGIYLLLKERNFSAGLFTAMSAAFWQLAIIYVLVVAGYLIFHRDKTSLLWLVAGALTAVILVVFPFFIWWDVTALVGGAIIAPLSSSDSWSLLELLTRLYNVPLRLKYATIVVVFAIPATVTAVADDERDPVIAVAGTAWFALQILFLDFDGTVDLVVCFPFVAILMGYYFSSLRINRQQTLALVFAVCLLVSGIGSGGLGLVFGSVQTNDTGIDQTDRGIYGAIGTLAKQQMGVSDTTNQPDESVRDSVPSIYTLYWEKQLPDRCHYWINKQSKTYIERTGTDPTQEVCTY
ncbi:DolP-mannose mannosyltransferase [Haloarchaeobius sp. HME9146]|uniref:DolP-mannose mannosyltransferase n=1 Tax=Haloarchaeobius sp. HME9146 TaxID=2978732 RepID=UPI0021BF2E81|nr:DolP-mannose mannosyltransferase [Haloarchaeobius sp. HME9146]MCT9097024.1 DolP-mannose mannosyltransferase [Haloarchaeobius sp. HME9146]